MANEKRLIDANALLALVKKNALYLYHMIAPILCLCPTVDAVEVVRCKDCKHWTMGYCNNFAYYDYEPTTNEDDFCSYGERREGE